MGFYVLSLVFSSITFVALIIYFPLVWLNVVFTFSALPGTDIPYYNPNNLPRYGPIWWILALDILRFLPIFYLFIMLSIPRRYAPKINPKSINTNDYSKPHIELRIGWNTLLAILIIIEILKFIAYMISWADDISVFDNCVDPPNAAGCSNYIFYMAWISALFFAIWDAVWVYSLGKSMQLYILKKED
jgi:hypothetical protein